MSSTVVSSSVHKISNELSSFLCKTPETSVICTNIENESEELKHKTQPLNLKTFRMRVDTFSPGLWSLRYLSPLTCARYGWLLLEKEVLQCVTCRAIVCTSLPSSTNPAAYDSFVEQLGSKLVDGHVEGCGWQHNPSPEYFTHPPNISSKDHLKNFTNNARSLLAMDENLPFLDNKKLCVNWGIDKSDLGNVFSSNIGLTEKQITAALLCLCGWTTSSDNFLLCNLCQRSVGMWNYCSRKTFEERMNIELKLIQNKNDKPTAKETIPDTPETEVLTKELINTEPTATKMPETEQTKTKMLGTKSTTAAKMLEIEETATKTAETEPTVKKMPEIEPTSTDRAETELQSTMPDKSGVSSEGDKNEQEYSQSSETKADKVTNSADTSANSKDSITEEKEDTDKMDDVSSTSDGEKTQDSHISSIGNNKRPSSSVDNDNLNEETTEQPSKRLCREIETSDISDQEQKEPSEKLNENSLQESVISAVKKKGKRIFDPLEEHRFWCGWVTERALSPELHDLYYHDLRGFQVLINQLKSYLRPINNDTTKSLKCKNNAEGLRAVRNLLDGWLTTEIDSIDEDALLK